MPGVLMLEALTQAGAWLVREHEDFAHSIVVLKQAKTIKYGSFVEPGRQLQLRVELVSHGERESAFKGVGVIDGQEMVKGRFTLTRYNLRDKDPALHATDASIVAGLRDLFATLRKGSVGARAMIRIVAERARRPGRGHRRATATPDPRRATGACRGDLDGHADVARISKNQQDRGPTRVAGATCRSRGRRAVGRADPAARLKFTESSCRRLDECHRSSAEVSRVPLVGLVWRSHFFEDVMPTQDEIFEKVQATLVDALGVDEEDVTRDATLQGDLGAESIDFLDIVFRLERNFGIKIPRGELFPENVVSDPEMIARRQAHRQGARRAEDPDALRRPDRVRRQPRGREDRRPLHGRHARPVRPEQALGLTRPVDAARPRRLDPAPAIGPGDLRERSRTRAFEL